MSRWIRKVPLLPRQAVPLRVALPASGASHDCAPPAEVDAAPRSIWECDCGRRWRIAAPYWRDIGVADGPSEVPEWVMSLGDGEEETSPSS